MSLATPHSSIWRQCKKQMQGQGMTKRDKAEWDRQYDRLFADLKEAEQEEVAAGAAFKKAEDRRTVALGKLTDHVNCWNQGKWTKGSEG